MRTIKTYRKVGAFYIACEANFLTVIECTHVECQFQEIRPTKPQRILAL